MKTKAVEINNYIVANPEICHGQPTFKGTRIMVWQILELLGANVTAEEILRDYFPQLSREAITAAINYASQVIEEERYFTFSEAKASV